MRIVTLAAMLLVAAGTARAGEADVVAAEAVPVPGGTWRFDVTVAHDDEGWGHYVDRIEVVAPDGTVLGTRNLVHPHEERRFTRSVIGVVVPDGVSTVTVRANDSLHEYGGAEVVIDLPPR